MTSTPAPAGNDPSRFIPKPPDAVAAAAAQADELLRAASGGEPANPPSGQPESEPPATPPDAQPSPEPVAPGVTEAEHQRNWERDFRAMQGRYEREQAANKQMAERLAGLETLLTQLSTQPPAVESQPAVAFERQVTPELENEYGKEFFDASKAAAHDALIPEIVQLKQDIQYLKSGMTAVGTSIARSAEDRMYDALDTEVGSQWEDINNHPGFHEWLAEVDPYAGRRRKEMLQEAFARHDGSRVVRFFKGFLAEAAATDPQTPPGALTQAPSPNGSAYGKVPLESFAAPGRAGPAAHTGPADKPTYSRSYIANFYRDKTAGHWRGREAEAAAIDADIIAAGREGRVTS